MVRGSVEETLNALLDADADGSMFSTLIRHIALPNYPPTGTGSLSNGRRRSRRPLSRVTDGRGAFDRDAAPHSNGPQVRLHLQLRPGEQPAVGDSDAMV